MTRWELISTGITGTGETQNGTVTGLTGEVCLQFFDREINFLSIADLTLSDLCKSLLEGTLEAIMWSKWGSPSIPLGRGDLHIVHPELCD